MVQRRYGSTAQRRNGTMALWLNGKTKKNFIFNLNLYLNLNLNLNLSTLALAPLRH